MILKVLILIFLPIFIINLNASDIKKIEAEKKFKETKKKIKKYLFDNGYHTKERDTRIFEIYFDLPELIYLKQNGYIKYEAVEYLSKKKQKRKYRENIVYSFDGNKTYNYLVRHYNNVKSFEEKHPLLSLVKRKDRQDFLNKLKNDGLKYPLRLKNIIQVSKLIHSIRIYSNTIQEGNIEIKIIKSSVVENSTTFLTFKINIDNPLLKKDILDIINMSSYNNINVSNEYLLVYKEISGSVKLFNWILEYPYIVNLLYAIIFGIFGIIIIIILFRKKFFN